jgi:inhibitor of cysteine peptidase
MSLARALVLVSVALPLAAACSSNPTADVWNRAPIVRNSDASIDGRSEAVKRGDTLAVHLDADPTTGYRWELTRLAGSSVTQIGLPDYQPETAAGVPRVGAPGHTTFRFRALASGTSSIELAYRRPGEGNDAAAKTVRFEIAVP